MVWRPPIPLWETFCIKFCDSFGWFVGYLKDLTWSTDVEIPQLYSLNSRIWSSNISEWLYSTPSSQLVVGVSIMYQLDHVSLRIDLSNMCNVRFVGLLETGTGHFRSTSSQPTSNRPAVTWHNVSTLQIWSLLFKVDAFWRMIKLLK